MINRTRKTGETSKPPTRQLKIEEELDAWSPFPTLMKKVSGKEVEKLRYHMAVMGCIHGLFILIDIVVLRMPLYAVYEIFCVWAAYQGFMYLNYTSIYYYAILMFFAGPLGMTRIFDVGLFNLGTCIFLL